MELVPVVQNQIPAFVARAAWDLIRSGQAPQVINWGRENLPRAVEGMRDAMLEVTSAQGPFGTGLTMREAHMEPRRTLKRPMIQYSDQKAKKRIPKSHIYQAATAKGTGTRSYWLTKKAKKYRLRKKKYRSRNKNKVTYKGRRYYNAKKIIDKPIMPAA